MFQLVLLNHVFVNMQKFLILLFLYTHFIEYFDKISFYEL